MHPALIPIQPLHRAHNEICENDLAGGDFHEPKVNGVGMGEFRCADDQVLFFKSQEGLENVMKCRCFRPLLFYTMKAELGRGQHGLMR